MSDMNKWLATGRLTRDPEITYTQKGIAICNFTLAVGRTWYQEGTGKKEETSFVDVTAFGKTAENIGQYFVKGNFMIMEGRLKQDTWEDRETGKTRSKLKVILDGFTFAPKSNGDTTSPARTERPATASRVQAPATRDDGGWPSGFPNDDEEDDIPF